jgi:molybdate transport system substrate-binding protein
MTNTSRQDETRPGPEDDKANKHERCNQGRNNVNHKPKRAAAIAAAVILTVTGMTAHAAEIRVLSTQATEEAYRELVPEFEKTTGHKVATTFTGTLDANKRLAAGEGYDLLIMSASSIDEHIKGGKVAPGSRVDLAKSGVGVGVKSGAPKPDISTTDALKKAILAAKSIGYSTGPSGVYIVGLFQRLGIADDIKGKLKQTPTGVFVGSIIASGEAEIGFQQVSELSHFAGVDYVGPLPADVQQFTMFSSGIIAGAKEADGAKALVKFITAPTAAAAFKKRGMEPG